MSEPVNLATAVAFHNEIASLHGEIARLRLTDAERAAVEWAVSAAKNVQHPADEPLRGLLERTK